MNHQIRIAIKEDIPAVLKLINELAVFEKEPDAVEVEISQLQQDGFGDSAAFVCFVAEIDSKIIGMALVYTRYSTWKGKVLHLEDLIVSKDFRGQNIGSDLLDQVIYYGAKLGVKRISWEVLDWNSSAIKFYESKGAKVLKDWSVVHLDETGITNYLKKKN